jgi:hypothetical protein
MVERQSSAPAASSAPRISPSLGLVTGTNDHYFSENGHNLGIHSTRGHFIGLEKKLLSQQHLESVKQVELVIAEQALQRETIFEHLVVQRSRSYVKESQRLLEGGAILFPTREIPRVAPYKLKVSYGRLLESVERAFSKTTPLFALAIYTIRSDICGRRPRSRRWRPIDRPRSSLSFAPNSSNGSKVLPALSRCRAGAWA